MGIEIAQNRQRNITLMFIFLIILSAASMQITEFNLVDAITAIPNAMTWMIANFYPNAQSLDNLPSILSKLKETVLLAIVTTTTASIFALLFALMSTRSNLILTMTCRLIASFFRNVPDTVWAIVLLLSFGQNIVSGYFALFFATFGFLTRSFIETIEEVSTSSVEALEATGATYFQVVFQAIMPSSITQIISWVLFMIETNIRSSTLVGMLTGTGVGHLFNLYYKSFDYNSASLVVVLIIIVIIAIEYISNYIRRVIL
ncbi:PhnE/PtxC family ABC transporter permease [Dendrosporobacter sp. 1207_IL3150]|uniref:PhnE/PtxC family ABC transporter permease n=1 Tax=Dendrosporobacter sp. 1207_IL3150 TaxID=3084054 RepID=UPI002FDA4A78